MKNYKLDLRNIYFAVVYLGLSITIFYLLYSEAYLNFLTPKSAKYLVFMVIVLFIFFISEFYQLIHSYNNTNIISSIVLLIPIGMATLPDLSISLENISTGYSINNLLQNSAQGYVNGNSLYKGETMTFTIEEKNSLTLKDANNSNSFLDRKEPDGIDKTNKIIEVSDDNFYDWVTRIFAHQDDYIGYTIKLNGKVFKSSEFMADNQFVPCRLLMTCCVVDTVPAGLIANYDKVNELNPGDWVQVTGKLVIGEYSGQKGPVIDVISINEGHKPKYEYVYAK